jgi:hypothetical protein
MPAAMLLNLFPSSKALEIKHSQHLRPKTAQSCYSKNDKHEHELWTSNAASSRHPGILIFNDLFIFVVMQHDLP